MENIKRYYPAIAVVLVLIIVATAGTWLVSNGLRSSARQQFAAAVNGSIDEIENDLKSEKADGQSIAQSYLITSRQHNAGYLDFQPRLKLLYDNISRRDADMVFVGVALRVGAAERENFEQTISNELGRTIAITEMDETGVMVTDVPRAEYYPMAFIEPQAAAESHVGMNIAADRVIAKAMRQAGETGFPAISGTLTIPKIDRNVSGYCVVVPVLAVESDRGGPGIAGYVIEYDSYIDLLNEVSASSDGYTGLAIFDSAASEPGQPVAVVGSGFNGRSTLKGLMADGSVYYKTISLKDHDWTVVAVPNPPDPAQKWLMAAIAAANFAFILLIAMYMFSSIRRSLALEAVEADLRLSYGELSQWAEKSEKRTTELTMLREMSDMLQTCDNTNEAFLVMSLFMYKLFKPHNGAIYLLDASRTTAEAKVAWGKNSPEEKTFAFNDCIALRRSDAYIVDDTSGVTLCAHVKTPIPSGYICLPMMSQGETFGLFYLADGGPDTAALEREDHVLATTVVEQLAMTLANITLREKLKEQSLTDHLTKLFNRRFMEDMLEREIKRADRNGQSIGFIMFDIDFFKDINDTYGHDAGDRVLETLGIFLKTSVRAEDIACRYGGEEFLLVMPGNDRENTVKRANEILERVQMLAIEDSGQTLPPIHLSGGVSVYPEDSKDKEQIIVKADEALYKAKKTGRNKIVVWADINKKDGL